LSQFFSTIKSQDSAFRFIFITGITKFNKTSIFSAFNNLSDISLIPEYGDIVRYHHDEVKKYFSGYIEKAAKELEVDSENYLILWLGTMMAFASKKQQRLKSLRHGWLHYPRTQRLLFGLY
ncbi:AAA family ATPase, partial [Parasutterella excrementihominis]